MSEQPVELTSPDPNSGRMVVGSALSEHCTHLDPSECDGRNHAFGYPKPTDARVD